MAENDCELVVVGAPAGGVEALIRFAHARPSDREEPSEALVAEDFDA